jgi:hypothetical protein
MYFSTVDFGTSMPILVSSPTIFGAPRIGGREPPDEDAHFFRDLRPSGLSRSAETRPMITESAALPGDDRSRLHEQEGVSPPGPEAGEPGPKEAVAGPESGPPPGALADGELVPEDEDLKLH